MPAAVTRSLTFSPDGNVVFTEGDTTFKGKASVFAAAVIKKNAPEVTKAGVKVEKPSLFILTSSDGKEYKVPILGLPIVLEATNKDHLPFGTYTVTVPGAAEAGVPVGLIIAGVAVLGAGALWFFGRR